MKTADKYVRARIEATLAKADVTPFDGTTVYAYVNHGRWVADCPCNGAELVAPDHEMLCGSCGARHTVEFPSDAADIEAALRVRDPFNQHWEPGETVDGLWAENIENGIFPEGGF